jgi:hypothetical protein
MLTIHRDTRETKYFGPWDDPEGTEWSYQDYVSNQCSKVTRDSKVGKIAEKPLKPRKDFPLWAHPTGPWAKKINGTTYYLGRWGDPNGAEEKYNLEPDDLMAGGFHAIASPAAERFRRCATSS